MSHIQSEIFVFFWFFWVYAGLVTFHYQNFWLFLSICRCCALLASKCCFILSICRFGEPQVPQTCIYFKNPNILIVKSHQTCIYSKKFKKSKSSHLCQRVPHRVWDFWFSWFFWVYAGLVTVHYQNFCFFEYMQVLCTFGIKMLFFWVYAGYVHSKHCIFCFSCRFWKGISHKTCRECVILKWTKLKWKTDSVFVFLSILSY